MARKPRICRNFAFYHVMLRGNNKQEIFFSDVDRIKFYLLLQEGVERFGHSIHAFCLMKNHVHLLIQTAETPLSKIVKHVAFRYAQYINNTKERVGHLFQGRFKAILVDERSYLMELVRYIHLNPVRAGIVTAPERYFWSGHRAYLKMETILWLTSDLLLNKFSTTYDTSRLLPSELYNDYIQNGMKENSRERKDFFLGEYHSSILGNEEFTKQVLEFSEKQSKRKIKCTVADLVKEVSTVLQLPISMLSKPGKMRAASQARGILAYLVRNEVDHLSLQDLANFLQRESSGLTHLANRIDLEVITDKELAGIIDKIKERLQISESQV